MAVRKPGKGNYTKPGAWRPIALLCTLGKIVETATANRLREAAEEFNLLPLEQMGFRAQRSTESALDLLASQIQSI